MSRCNAAGQETLRRAMQRPTCQKREEEWRGTGRRRAVLTASRRVYALEEFTTRTADALRVYEDIWRTTVTVQTIRFVAPGWSKQLSSFNAIRYERNIVAF